MMFSYFTFLSEPLNRVPPLHIFLLRVLRELRPRASEVLVCYGRLPWVLSLGFLPMYHTLLQFWSFMSECIAVLGTETVGTKDMKVL